MRGPFAARGPIWLNWSNRLKTDPDCCSFALPYWWSFDGRLAGLASYLCDAAATRAFNNHYLETALKLIPQLGKTNISNVIGWRCHLELCNWWMLTDVWLAVSFSLCLFSFIYRPYINTTNDSYLFVYSVWQKDVNGCHIFIMKTRDGCLSKILIVVIR